MGFIIKIAYKSEGYSQWRTENVPIPIYSSEQDACERAYEIFIQEVDSTQLDSSFKQNLQSLIDNNNYIKAVEEINFSDTLRFSVIKTVNVTARIKNNNPVSLKKNGTQCRKCSIYNSYAIPDGADGMHTCYACKV